MVHFLWIFISVLFISGFSSSSHAYDEARLKEVAISKYWLRLLHYKKRVFGGYKSLAVTPMFFLSPEGPTDPLAELKKDLELFAKTDVLVDDLKENARCAFPARYQYLNEQLSLNFPEVKCEAYDTWREGLDPSHLTLVYSSAYPNNPASMFGHTLLRIDRKQADDLRNYGVNFAAIAPDQGAEFKTAMLGLVGGFRGQFTLSPYYIKVNEYTNSESRDLWEYSLNLTPAQLDRVIKHFWELFSKAMFDYYFIDNNCSYQLLALLEVADVNWDLLSHFDVFVLPSDTAKVVERYSGAVSAVKFRPSYRKKMIQRRGALNSAQEKLFVQIATGEIPVTAITDVKLADAVISYFNFVKYRDKENFSEKDKSLLSKALIERTHFKSASSDPLPEIPAGTRPDGGHDSSSIGLKIGAVSNRRVAGFVFRPTLHDLLNKDLGFEPFSQIDLLHGTLDYLVDDKQLRLNEIKFVEIMSLASYDPLDPQFSWRLAVGIDTLKDISCTYCHRAYAEGAAGRSYLLANQSLMTYGLIGLSFEGSSFFPKMGRAGPFGILGAVYNPWEKYKVQGSLRASGDVVNTFNRFMYLSYEFNQSYALATQWDLRLRSTFVQRFLDEVPNYFEYGLQVFYYY